jgi:hypothetical protein
VGIAKEVVQEQCNFLNEVATGTGGLDGGPHRLLELHNASSRMMLANSNRCPC